MTTHAPAEAFASALGALLFSADRSASDSTNTAAAPAAGRAALVVAYSGGRDSTVLLHLARRYAAAQQLPLRAIHINHQLQPAAAAFAAHCQQICSAWGIPLTVLTVDVPRSDKGLEADARAARYAALAAQLQASDILLLGQHADDQIETLLLQLLRGAGPSGLAAMPAVARCGPARLLRPLLSVRRDAITALAQAEQWPWIEDPSNADTELARNRLRAELMPVLLAQRQGAAEVLLRAVHWQAEAAALLTDLAAIDVTSVQHANGFLSRQALQRLSPARQANLLRGWLQQQGHAMPNAEPLQHFLQQLAADSDRVQLLWAGQCLRVYGDQIAVTPAWPETSLATQTWPGPTALSLPLQLGQLSWCAQPVTGALALRPARADEQVSVRWQTPGLRVKLPNRQGRRELKDLFQAAQVPVWLRPYWPKLFYNDELIALPGLLVTEAGMASTASAAGSWQLQAEGLLFSLARRLRTPDANAE